MPEVKFDRAVCGLVREYVQWFCGCGNQGEPGRYPGAERCGLGFRGQVFDGGQLPHIRPEPVGGPLFEEESAAAFDGDDVVMHRQRPYAFGGDGHIRDTADTQHFTFT